MNTADLIAIDTHTHLEVSCRKPFGDRCALRTDQPKSPSSM